MTDDDLVFNPPPGWPRPPASWRPPTGWKPDPEWPDPPPGWQLWVRNEATTDSSPVGTSPHSPESQSSGGEPASGVEDELTSLRLRVSELEKQNAALREHSSAAEPEELVLLDDEAILQSVGIYRYHHPLENAVAYKARLKALGSRIAELTKTRQAVLVSNTFTYDNSLSKGRKMASDLSRLMLRAYNAEADNCIRSLRAGNVVTAMRRLDASRRAVKRLGKMMEMEISEQYHDLRVEEIELTADYLAKKQEEREAAREERARLREQRKVEAELKAEREKLDKEREHITNALAVLAERGEADPDLESRLKAIDEAIVQNDYRAANVRAGYVYVISNRGAFGVGVVKIGLTRRLDPLDRVTELSGASVPFRFDIHCVFFSEDAVGLEAELHRHFAHRRLNHANSRKEFFFATPAEVREVLESKVGNLLEFREEADSTEFFQSLAAWPVGRQR